MMGIYAILIILFVAFGFTVIGHGLDEISGNVDAIMSKTAIALLISVGVLSLAALASIWAKNPKPFLTAGCGVAMFFVMIQPPEPPRGA